MAFKVKLGNIKKSYGKEEQKLIKIAYDLAKNAHKGQRQKCGKPYLDHVMEVAYYLSKWDCDAETVIAALLHDSVEDTKISFKDIEKNQGRRVRYLVDGMSWERKIIKGELQKDWPGYFRKFGKYVVKEPVLVLIKMADSLSNIKNAKLENDKVRTRGARHSLEFWVPLFRNLGFIRLAKKSEKRAKNYLEENTQVKLYDYISRSSLNKIRKELDNNKKLGRFR